MKNLYSADAISEVMPRKLKEFRINSGLTIKQVGQILNKTTAAVSLWEKGKALPDVNTLIKLSEIYNVADVNQFLDPCIPPDMTTLSMSEQEHIKLWRNAPSNVKNAITTLLKMCNNDVLLNNTEVHK